MEVEYNPPLQHSQRLPQTDDNIFEVDIEDFKKLEAKVLHYEELTRKDKKERTSQIKTIVDEKIAEISTKFQSQLTEMHSFVMELSADLDSKL